MKSGGEQFTFPATAKLWSTSTITLLLQKFQLQQQLLLSLLLYTFLNLYLTPRWHCQKDGQFFMSTVTARALPSLKKFSYNDNKHDTLTIYYYYKIPCQFCPPARKIPLSPSILYAPPSPLSLLLSNKTENFLLMIESKI